jgi:hypothetical protein
LFSDLYFEGIHFMEPRRRHKFDIYTELYPASSVAIIGTGIITITMGELLFGIAISLSGVAIGLAGPVARAVHERKVARRRKH